MRTPAVGIASQSGALSQSLAQAMECGASVSHVFSAGTRLTWICGSGRVSRGRIHIVMQSPVAFEGLAPSGAPAGGGANRLDCNKPLLVNKIATGQMGGRGGGLAHGVACRLEPPHTRRLRAGGHGVVEDFEALMEAAAFFSKAPHRRRKVSPCSQLRAERPSWRLTGPKRMESRFHSPRCGAQGSRGA